jgi:hypothetical protein
MKSQLLRETDGIISCTVGTLSRKPATGNHDLSSEIWKFHFKCSSMFQSTYSGMGTHLKWGLESEKRMRSAQDIPRPFFIPVYWSVDRISHSDNKLYQTKQNSIAL